MDINTSLLFEKYKTLSPENFKIWIDKIKKSQKKVFCYKNVVSFIQSGGTKGKTADDLTDHFCKSRHTILQFLSKNKIKCTRQNGKIFYLTGEK